MSDNKENEIPKIPPLDDENDILFNTKKQPPRLLGGTLPALVNRLTQYDKLDYSFNDTFLLTYQCFTTSRELFELLVKRFHIKPPEGIAQADYEIWREKQQRPVRLQVLNVLKSWLDDFWTEDQSEATAELIRDIQTFANDLDSTETPERDALRVILEQRLRGHETDTKRPRRTSNQPAPTPIMPKNIKKLKFLSIDAIECARQLTIIESTLYAQIRPVECMKKNWQKKVGKDQPDLAPNIRAATLHSEQVINWVAEMILSQRGVGAKVAAITYFVSIADACRELNNYEALFSITSALGSAPVHRLKHIWDQVPAQTASMLDQLRQVTGATKGFLEYRECVHLANPPCIPWLVFFLTDCAYVEDGTPSKLRKTTMINFRKSEKMAAVIREFQQCQSEPYCLQPVPQIQQYLLSSIQAAVDVSTWNGRSLAVEAESSKWLRFIRYTVGLFSRRKKSSKILP